MDELTISKPVRDSIAVSAHQILRKTESDDKQANRPCPRFPVNHPASDRGTDRLDEMVEWIVFSDPRTVLQYLWRPHHRREEENYLYEVCHDRRNVAKTRTQYAQRHPYPDTMQ